MKYQYNTLAEVKTSWTTSAGMQIVAGHRLVEETNDLFDNGEYTRKGLSIHTFATVNGKDEPHVYSIGMLGKRPDTLVAKIGRIGLDQSKLEMVNATLTEIESHPEWQALQAARAAGEKVRREYAADQRRLDNMMTLNGRSY